MYHPTHNGRPCIGARCAECQPKGHKGAGSSTEMIPPFADPCVGQHCAGRVRVHRHRGGAIPNHVTYPRRAPLPVPDPTFRMPPRRTFPMDWR